jgi:DNA-binding NtrC family response regulator
MVMIPNVLMIVSSQDNMLQELSEFLMNCDCEVIVRHNLVTSIQQAQNSFFDVILLDTNVKGMDICQAIKIFKNLNPKIKIIVKTNSSSKDFEAQIRKENIYYYHIETFDSNDLMSAISSAIKDTKKQVSY